MKSYANDENIRVISHDTETLAILIKSSFNQNGIHFFTPVQFSQQLGYMSHPAGHLIKPHVHKPVTRAVINTQEVLYIKSGKIRVDFYTQDQKYLESQMLASGDVILLASGGHGFEILEKAEIIEIKQGPFNADVDKIKFNSENNQPKIFK